MSLIIRKFSYYNGKFRNLYSIPQVESKFTEADINSSMESFLAVPGNDKLMERLDEVEQRIPWCRSVIRDLRQHIYKHGNLTEPQRSLATNLYLDCCMISDEKIAEQVRARKLGFRLLSLELGTTRHFVSSVMNSSETRALTFRQIGALDKIAHQFAQALANSHELTDEEFDGWYTK